MATGSDRNSRKAGRRSIRALRRRDRCSESQKRRSRADGREVLAAIRMSDTHHTHIGHTHPLCPQFASDNRQFVIQQPDGRTNETADYYVRRGAGTFQLNIMREIAERVRRRRTRTEFRPLGQITFPRRGREGSITDGLHGRDSHHAGRCRETRRDRLTLGVRVPESIAACWLAESMSKHGSNRAGWTTSSSRRGTTQIRSFASTSCTIH